MPTEDIPSLDEADQRALAIAARVQDHLAIARSLARIATSVLRDRASEALRDYAQAAMIEVAKRDRLLRAHVHQLSRVARAVSEAASHAAAAADARRQSASARSTRTQDVDPDETERQSYPEAVARSVRQ